MEHSYIHQFGKSEEASRKILVFLSTYLAQGYMNPQRYKKPEAKATAEAWQRLYTKWEAAIKSLVPDAVNLPYLSKGASIWSDPLRLDHDGKIYWIYPAVGSAERAQLQKDYLRYRGPGHYVLWWNGDKFVRLVN